MAESTRLRVAPGVFVAWGADGPVISHVDRPLDTYSISSDLMRVVAHLDSAKDVDSLLDDWDVEDANRASVHTALDTLAEAGLLAVGDSPVAETLRDPAHGDALRLAVQRVTAAIFAGVPLVGMVIVCQWVVSGGSAPFQPVGRGLVSSVLDTSQPRKARSLLASSRRAMVTRGRGRRCDEAADRLDRR